jgi:hypothetical protein
VDAGGAKFQVRGETIEEDVMTKKKPIRLGITLDAPQTNVVVTLRIMPVVGK